MPLQTARRNRLDGRIMRTASFVVAAGSNVGGRGAFPRQPPVWLMWRETWPATTRRE
jgi:hypothetical protein